MLHLLSIALSHSYLYESHSQIMAFVPLAVLGVPQVDQLVNRGI